MVRMHSASLSATKWAWPVTSLWTLAPPRSSMLTFSPVTDLMTPGPVITMWLVPFTITTKSVKAGE